MNDSEQHSRPEVTVFLPCHSLEDLSEWMENDEASAILNAWTVAWHPFVICESEGLPSWASVDLPWTREGKIVGIIPEGLSERFVTEPLHHSVKDKYFYTKLIPNHFSQNYMKHAVSICRTVLQLAVRIKHYLTGRFLLLKIFVPSG